MGQANHDYDYGRQIIAMNLFPKMATGFEPANKHSPAALNAIQPVLDEWKNTPGLGLEFTWMLLQLVGAMGVIPPFPIEAEAAHASWKTGTQDFLITPVAVEDGVHTVSKIISLFNLPTAADLAVAGVDHARLGWTGVSASIDNFLKGFVALGVGKQSDWTPEKLEPLRAYLESLSAPKAVTAQDPIAVKAGEKVFASAGCGSCHNGPAFGGKKAYTFAEIGTDPAMAKWLDPDADGVPIKNPILQPGDKLTNGIKVPRLAGVWSAKRLLHNGSVDSLEALLCLDSSRPTVTAVPWSDTGHTMGCNELTVTQKKDLIAYLRSL
ncbi:MAG: hypothetical protein FJ100_19510 [Deltaproteobacteria bacterium]|nr:hypothetical protein [Deltaproteobacteria bacterium]